MTQHKISPAVDWPIKIAILCGSVQISDGYDIGSIGTAAPALTNAWHISPASLSHSFVASGIGMLIGAMLAGPSSDRWGRKPVILISVLLIGLFSLSCGFTNSLLELTAFRFVTGLGLGGAMPATVALTAEHSPPRHRATIIMLMFCGTSVGGFLSAQLGARMLPHFGWQGVFLLGGAFPLLLLPFLMMLLPRASNSVSSLQTIERNPVRAILSATMLPQTLLFWVLFFANLFAQYEIISWLPTALNQTGVPLQSAIYATSLFAAGSVLGTIMLGPLADRFGTSLVLTIALAAGACMVGVLTIVALPHWLLLATICGAGIALGSAPTAACAFAAEFYPASIRATGVGWALGIGRIGTIVGPAIGGAMLAFGMAPRSIFLAAALASLVASLATCSLWIGMKRTIQIRGATAPPPL